MKKNDNLPIGASIIRDLAKANGLKQTDIADMLGVTQGAISQHMNSDVRMKFLMQLLTVLGYKMVLVKSRDNAGEYEIGNSMCDNCGYKIFTHRFTQISEELAAYEMDQN